MLIPHRSHTDPALVPHLSCWAAQGAQPLGTSPTEQGLGQLNAPSMGSLGRGVMEQPWLSEALGIFCHHHHHSTGSEASERVLRILINLFAAIFSSLDWIRFAVLTLPSKEESVGIAPGSLKRPRSVHCVCRGGSGAAQILPWPSQIAKGLEPGLLWFELCPWHSLGLWGSPSRGSAWG